MKTIVTLFCACICALAFSLSAQAGPFGLEMGQPLSELDVKSSGPKVRLNSVPKPHPDFTTYGVWASDKTGVCKIKAFSESFDDDKYGNSVRDAMLRYVDAFDEKYGSHEKVDFLRDGALWSGPGEWVMAIKQNERVYGFYWNELTHGEEDNLGYIEMIVFPFSSDKAAIGLEYRSKDYDACAAAINAEADDSF